MRVAVVGTILLVLSVCPSAWAEQSQQEILKASGIQGGLIVHIGCGDGMLSTSLGAGNSFVVQGLDVDPAKVAKSRAAILSRGLGEKVSADPFDGQHLPYVDNLANLVVAEDLGQTAMPEVMRVLCPGGVAYVNQKGTWTRTVKPSPPDSDEWTHFLHDPQGTSVSSDRLVGAPGGLHWTGGPFWSRNHDNTASMHAMVSAGGRVFYVMDEGRIESIQLPSKYVLTARDAFNGVVLWKRPLKGWFNALYPCKSGPGWMPRRLVAVKDRVYLAPGVGQDLLCLDAATGKVLRKYDGTATTFELIVSDGVVFAAVNSDEKPCDYDQQDPNCWKEQDRASVKWAWTRDRGTRVLKALRADDGELLWQRNTPLVPMTLAADAGMVCFHDGNAVVAFERRSGTDLWRTDTLALKEVRTGYAGPRLVLHQAQVLFSPLGHIVALDARTGKTLWSVDGKPRSGHFSLEDFYVVGNKVWVLGPQGCGLYSTYSLADGQKLAEHRNPIDSFYIHQRCYPGRATERILLPPIMGTTIYDLEKDTWSIDDWVRGGCIYGVMPANGMLYASPHACACYYQSKLNGFNALSSEPQPSGAPAVEKRLLKGPAYGTANKQFEYSAADWPVFRHDNARSGYVRTDVPAEVSQVWKRPFGTKLGQPVAAGGKLFLSAVDAHVVYALDAASGRESWHFIAGGRVNSPPTLYHGLAIFGCADGCVYALSSVDGRLAWKFQAAPNDRKLMADGQLESVWPLAGSVLIQDSKLYCVAGRSMFLDGGLRMLLLRPETGELLAEHVMDRRVPDTQQDLQDLMTGKHMPVAMPDILSGDGQYVYMKSQTFTADGKRLRVSPQRPDTQYDEELHLFSPISFLDESWHQRTYWLYGRAAGEGWAEFQLPPKRVPYGRILCLDEKNAYGYARHPGLMCNTSISEYRLYCADKTPVRKVGIPKLEGKWPAGQYPTDDPLAGETVNWKQLSQQPMEKLSALSYHWVHEQPDIMAKAMVLANDRLFIAGPRHVADERQMWGHSNEKAFQQKMEEQAAWLQGEHGGYLQVVSKQDGTKLAQYKLESLPAFDGLIAANGSLYLVGLDGSILCFRGE